MSILDDAIREHLELKRAHGADDSELKKLEDEAFGPPGRPGDPDSFSEEPTEFLAAPATDAADAAAEAQAEPSGRRLPNIADLQEAPEPAEPDSEDAPLAEEESSAEQTIPVPQPEAAPEVEKDAPPEEAVAAKEDDGAPASEDAAPEIDAGHSTEEREAIAEQPTELFDVEADLGAGGERRSPSDEQLLDSKLSEPRLAPVEPTGEIEATGPDAEVAGEPLADEEEEDDDFFSEQRLSDELNQALEAPITDEHEAPSTEAPAPAFPETDEHEAAPPSEEHTAVYDVADHGKQADESDFEDEDEGDDRSAAKHDDVLEDTPDFLEDAPEDDELWFEQKPPKDFDFDD